MKKIYSLLLMQIRTPRNTVIAIPRSLIAIIESDCQSDGSVMIPKVFPFIWVAKKLLDQIKNNQ